MNCWKLVILYADSENTNANTNTNEHINAETNTVDDDDDVWWWIVNLITMPNKGKLHKTLFRDYMCVRYQLPAAFSNATMQKANMQGTKGRRLR